MDIKMEAIETETVTFGSEGDLTRLLSEFFRVDDKQEFTNNKTPYSFVFFSLEDGYGFFPFGDDEERLEAFIFTRELLGDFLDDASLLFNKEASQLLGHDRIHFRVTDDLGEDLGVAFLNSMMKGTLTEDDIELAEELMLTLLYDKNEHDTCFVHILHVDEGNFFGFHLHNIKLLG